MFLATMCESFEGASLQGAAGPLRLLHLRHQHYLTCVKPVIAKMLSGLAVHSPSCRKAILRAVTEFFRTALDLLLNGRFPHVIENHCKMFDEHPLRLARHFYFTKNPPSVSDLSVTVDGLRFDFLMQRLDSVPAAPKFVYTVDSVEDSTIALRVSCVRSGRKTLRNLVDELRRSGLSVSSDAVERAVRIFEKQATSDCFLAKDPEDLLLRLLNQWLLGQAHGQPCEPDWDLWQSVKELATRLIRAIVPLERKIVQVWNEPRTVIESHYVISLDRMIESRPNLIHTLVRHPGFKDQLSEWTALGFISDGSDLDEASLVDVLTSPPQSSPYLHLPVDTRYFLDMEPEIVEALGPEQSWLDGQLIHSENYQALSSLLPSLRGRIKSIYVDPPFNKGYDAGFSYSVNYDDSSWVALLENRFNIAHQMLAEDGCMAVRCDHSGNMLVRLLMDELFGRENFRNEIHVRRFRKNVMEREIRRLPSGLDTIFIYSKSDAFTYIDPFRPRRRPRKGFWRHMNDSTGPGRPKTFFGRTMEPPPGKHWKYSQRRIDQMIEEGRLILQCRRCGHIHGRDDGEWAGCPECGADDPVPRYWVEARDVDVLDSNWSDIYGYSNTWGFQTENSEALLKRVIEITSRPGDLVMDFFLGSGTTTAVAHKMRRHWIGIEMGDHFNTIILPRMKKVLAGEQSGVSKEVGWTGGGCFKYVVLEDFWNALSG